MMSRGNLIYSFGASKGEVRRGSVTSRPDNVFYPSGAISQDRSVIIVPASVTSKRDYERESKMTRPFDKPIIQEGSRLRKCVKSSTQLVSEPTRVPDTRPINTELTNVMKDVIKNSKTIVEDIPKKKLADTDRNRKIMLDLLHQSTMSEEEYNKQTKNVKKRKANNDIEKYAKKLNIKKST